MRIEAGSKLVMIGDSITDCGRARPIGEGLFGALGTGYVGLVDGFLGAVYPERRIRVVNMGTSGDTVRHLKARWQSDVRDLAPDWLSVMIGINDVWRQFDSYLQPEAGVPLDEYEQTLEALLAEVRPRLKGLVVMTPFFIEPRGNDAMRAMMDAYGAAAKAVAGRHDAVVVDTQAAFDAVLAHTPSAALAWDRVHPNTTGHMILARAFLDGVGFRWAGAREG